MALSPALNFQNRDLRDRSFCNHSLNGADFSGADLRGCDFTGASLQGACFDGAVLGWTPRQLLRLLLWVIPSTLLLADAVTRLMFGALGRTPAENGWSFVLMLYGSLAIAGLGTLPPTSIAVCRSSQYNDRGGIALHILNQLLNQFAHCCTWRYGRRLWLGLVGLWFGALPGFCYGGVWTGNDSRWAIAGAFLGGLVALIASLTTRGAARWAALFLMSLIAAYGFAFLMGAWAIAFFAVAELLPGLVLVLLTLLYGLLTVQGGWLAYRCIRFSLGTCFQKANLMNATFAAVNLEGGNFDQSGFTGVLHIKA